MSTSLYFTASRSHALTDTERSIVRALEARFSVATQAEIYSRTREGPAWEEWCVYDSSEPTAPEVIYEGATRLPDDSPDTMWLGLQHWCRLLTAIRRELPDARWYVAVDDHEIEWNPDRQEYDPSQ